MHWAIEVNREKIPETVAKKLNLFSKMVCLKHYRTGKTHNFITLSVRAWFDVRLGIRLFQIKNEFSDVTSKGEPLQNNQQIILQKEEWFIPRCGQAQQWLHFEHF